MDQTVAVIGGTGDLGYALAQRWAKAGVDLIIGSRDRARAEDAAKRIRDVAPGAKVAGAENAEAAAQAGIAVLTVPFAAQAATLKSIRPAFKQGILVDTTVPLAAAIGGRPTRVLGVWEGSCAQAAAQGMLADVKVVSGFHNVSAELLHDLNATP